MSEGYIILRTYSKENIAFADKDKLEKSGVDCFLKDKDTVLTQPKADGNATGYIMLMVKQEAVSQALAILTEQAVATDIPTVTDFAPIKGFDNTSEKAQQEDNKQSKNIDISISSLLEKENYEIKNIDNIFGYNTEKSVSDIAQYSVSPNIDKNNNINNQQNDDGFEVLKSYANANDAQKDKNILEQAGFECFVKDNNVLNKNHQETFFNFDGSVSLLVKKINIEKAQTLLAEKNKIEVTDIDNLFGDNATELIPETISVKPKIIDDSYIVYISYADPLEAKQEKLFLEKGGISCFLKDYDSLTEKQKDKFVFEGCVSLLIKKENIKQANLLLSESKATENTVQNNNGNSQKNRSETLVVLRTYNYQHEALIDKLKLEEAGIKCMIKDETFNSALQTNLNSTTGNIKLLVIQDDVDEAEAVLENMIDDEVDETNNNTPEYTENSFVNESSTKPATSFSGKEIKWGCAILFFVIWLIATMSGRC